MVHLVFLAALFCTFPDLNRKYPFRFYTFAILFIFLALRYDYGNDYMGYLEIHTALNSGLPAWGQSNILFKNLNLLIPNFYVFIAIVSFFYIYSIYYLINKNIKIRRYWFAVLILLINPYLFLVHLSGLRQTLAICLFIFAVNYATEKNIVGYVIFSLLAVGMHSSAIILLPVYFLNEKTIDRKRLLIIIGIILTMLVTPAFDIFANKLLEYMPVHYRRYYEQGLQNSLRATVLSSFFFFLILFNMKLLKGKQIIYAKLSLIATMISILAVKVSMLTRIGMYFEVFTIITIPLIFENMDRGLKKKLLFAIMITIYLLRYYSFFTNPMWESFLQYKTILSQ
jgi:hypothetical protein